MKLEFIKTRSCKWDQRKTKETGNRLAKILKDDRPSPTSYKTSEAFRCGRLFKKIVQIHCGIYEQNYIVIGIDGRTRLVTNAYFVHNTKVLSSKEGEGKVKKMLIKLLADVLSTWKCFT